MPENIIARVVERKVIADALNSREPELAAVWGRRNLFSANHLIPPTLWSQFAPGSYTDFAVSEFARSVGISPGIVVGRLQHERRVPHSHMNNLKVRYKWS